MTIPKEDKRLSEVDFSIAVVPKQSTREKSIRHGHPLEQTQQRWPKGSKTYMEHRQAGAPRSTA
jgi:hypothetical protein